MKPASLSATALAVAQACPARYHAEHIQRSKGFGGVAANIGTAVHGGLEMFVKHCYIDKVETPSEKFIKECFGLSYAQTFGSFDNTTDEYADGFDLSTKWFKRTHSDGTFDEPMRVVSVEIKDNFPVPTSIGPIPFNYIWDRFDEIRPGVFKVVDYKTNRWNFTFDQFKKKIQVRAYAMAAAIQLKKQEIPYERIIVEYDMLRHSPMGMAFTYEDNKAFWEYLRKTVEGQIIGIEDEDTQGEPIPLPEKLNPECLFCVRKAECGALKKNISVGGIHALSFEEAIDLRAQVNWQQSGLNSLATELENKITAEAKEKDMVEWYTQDTKLSFAVSRSRKIDGERAKHVLGNNLWERYGKEQLTIGNVDKLLKGDELTDEQKKELRGLIFTETGTPKLKLEPVNPIDDD